MRPTKRRYSGAVRRPKRARPSGTTPIWRLRATVSAGEVFAEDVDAAGGGGEQAGEHLDGGGFACAVGAEEAEELAGSDGEIDVADCGELAETAGEGGGVNGRGV